MSKKTLIIVIGFALTLVFTSCDTIKMKCSDGRTVLSYRHPEKRYAEFVKVNDNKFKGAINILDKVKIADLDLSTKTTVTELRDKLNNESSRFEIIAKSAYYNFNQDPCNPNQEYYKMLGRLADLETLKATLESTIYSGGVGGLDDAKVKKAVSDFNSKEIPSFF